jgi:hypothetical protein
MARKKLDGETVHLSVRVKKATVERIEEVDVPVDERLSREPSLGDKVRHVLKKGLKR